MTRLDEIRRANFYMIDKETHKRIMLEKRIVWVCWTITSFCMAAIIAMAIYHW